MDLDWSIPFRMLPSEIWKTKNSQTDADPCGKSNIVDKCIDVRRAKVKQ